MINIMNSVLFSTTINWVFESVFSIRLIENTNTLTTYPVLFSDLRGTLGSAASHTRLLFLILGRVLLTLVLGFSLSALVASTTVTRHLFTFGVGVFFTLLF